jgi:RNA methyltransferase, TrmH family
MARLQITSPHNPRVKAAARLRDRKGRQQQQRIVIDGQRELTRALDAGIDVQEIFFAAHAVDQQPQLQTLLDRAEQTGARLLDTVPAVLEKLAFGNRNEGLVAIAATPQRNLNDLRLPELPLVVVLESIEKPGNVGAVLRSAEAAGVHALLLANPASDLFNPNTIRASLGAVFTVPCVAAAGMAIREWIRTQDLTILAARVDANAYWYQADMRQPLALVFGSEAQGLSSDWSDDQVTPLRIPMAGRVDSLNVSVAAAVLLFEAVRQRSAT